MRDLSDLRRVNIAVNAMPYKSDPERYHQTEFWELIDRRGGDCEDYALEKRRRLLDLGWPVDQLRLAVAKVDGLGHAVLTVDTPKGTYVLDNRFQDVKLWTELPYDWLYRQKGKGWVNIP